MVKKWTLGNCVIGIAASFVSIWSTSESIAAPPMALGDAEVVPFGGWEVWLSFAYKESGDHEKAYKTPTFEIIYGILPRLELGVEATYIVESGDDGTTDGIDAVAIQPKLLLLKETERIPAVTTSLMFEMGSNEDKDSLDWEKRVWAPSLALQKHFGKVLAITQVKYYDDDKWRYGMDVMYAATESLKLVGEVYGQTFVNSENRGEVNFRLGFKYSFTEYAKFYFAGGRSFLPAKANRPLFEAVTGLMIEF